MVESNEKTREWVNMRGTRVGGKGGEEGEEELEDLNLLRELETSVNNYLHGIWEKESTISWFIGVSYDT